MDIYYVNLGELVNIPEIGKRPIVVYKIKDNKAYCLKITSRNKAGKTGHFARMNPYMIHGYCNLEICYIIDKKALKPCMYQRECTLSEIETIKNKICIKEYIVN